jgi:hypothetical protein
MLMLDAKPATFPLTPHLTVFTDEVSGRGTVDDVLDAMDALAKKCLPQLSVLGAARFPLKTSDWRSTRLGKDVFLHSSVPQGWWEEYASMAQHEQDPGVMMARPIARTISFRSSPQRVTIRNIS